MNINDVNPTLLAALTAAVADLLARGWTPDAILAVTTNTRSTT